MASCQDKGNARKVHRKTPSLLAGRQGFDALDLLVEGRNPWPARLSLHGLRFEKPLVRFLVVALMPVARADAAQGVDDGFLPDDFVTAGLGEGQGRLEFRDGLGELSLAHEQ